MAQTEALRTDALRALVTLMRSADRTVALDYGELAGDLFWLQFPSAAHRVRLRWGRGLHRRSIAEQESANKPANDETEQI